MNTLLTLIEHLTISTEPLLAIAEITGRGDTIVHDGVGRVTDNVDGNDAGYYGGPLLFGVICVWIYKQYLS